MCWEVAHRFVRDPASPHSARQFCADALRPVMPGGRDAEALIDDAELVVSELVTNALNAHCTSGELRLLLHRHCLELSVFDDATGTPVPQIAAITDDHGRGLAIVAAVAARWGVESTPLGKRVWADLVVPQSIAEHVECHA